MWGNLITETAFTYSFTFGFPTKQSNILMHLTHWQYWFWFWFTYYMVLYYFIFLRLIRYRVLKMSPKISTSFRSHGKWGDLIVCFVPLSWCLNILTNSNYILRMIEWQTESSLFTLRVRGKQWYWVYKFELKSLSDLSSTSLNVGNNFWVNKNQTQKHHYLGLMQEKHTLSNNHLNWTASGNKQLVNNNEVFTNTIVESSTNSNFSSLNNNLVSAEPVILTQATNNYYLKHSYAWRTATTELTTTSYSTPQYSFTSQTSNSSSFQSTVTRVNKTKTSLYTPIRLLKSSDNMSLKTQFGNPSAFYQKPTSGNFYLVIKQKRYEPTSMSSNKHILKNEQLVRSNFSAQDSSMLAQHSRFRSEVTSLQTNRRLLRTRRVLVLPAHTNVTLITNSFDVMHSWYIPGLGIKLDCVPGRSTHHTIHIDHAGFYYGQCAEICGRYHHHMPIRVCALPFEHFLIWWYHYGAPFFLAGNQDRSNFIKNSSKQINW